MTRAPHSQSHTDDVLRVGLRTNKNRLNAEMRLLSQKSPKNFFSP